MSDFVQKLSNGYMLTQKGSEAWDRGYNVGSFRALIDGENTVFLGLGDSGDIISVVDNQPELKYFSYKHLPDNLQEVSKPFFGLALHILTKPPGKQREHALQRLLESKDATVRSAL